MPSSIIIIVIIIVIIVIIIITIIIIIIIIIIIVIIIIITFQKGEQRGHIIIKKTTHTLPHIHSHRSSRQRIPLHEIHKLFNWHD